MRTIALLSTLLMAAAPALASEYTPSDDDTAVHRALSARHWDGDCAAVEALAKDSVQTLQNIVDHAKAPAWAPMRAATCLIRGHATDKQPEIERWVTEPELLGLGILSRSMLDDMPEPVAVAVATKALNEGPAELEARDRVANVEHAPVRALVVETP